METIFYRNDDYQTMKRKFKAAWTNLQLVIHRSGHTLWKEGADPYEDDTVFSAAGIPNSIIFTLTDETLAGEAIKLFAKNCGGEPRILAKVNVIDDAATLGWCNNPFILPLNVDTYAEFKRRFSEHWENLSIQLYDVSPDEISSAQTDRELKDDFEMRNLKYAYDSFLHDYVSISNWNYSLKMVQIIAVIKNEVLDIYCENNLLNLRLRQFNDLKNV